MSTQKNSQNTKGIAVSVEIINDWKQVLAEQAEEASNETIRNCIRLYNPEKPTKDNIELLKSCRKDSIEFPVQNDQYYEQR